MNNPYENLFSKEPEFHCPVCDIRLHTEWVDNGFGAYSVQVSPYHCEGCEWTEKGCSVCIYEKCFSWEKCQGRALLTYMAKKKHLNTLMESAALIKRLELNSEIKYAYLYAKREFGSNFDAHISAVAEEILTLQRSCKSGTSYYIAGIILTLPPEDTGGISEKSNANFAFYSMMVKAAIAWGLLNGHGDKKNPFLDELREL